VVIVSDRATFGFVERASNLHLETNSGSVSLILERAAAALAGRNVSWVTVTTRDADVRAERAGRLDQLAATAGYLLRPVHVRPDVHRAYYADVGVRMLW